MAYEDTEYRNGDFETDTYHWYNANPMRILTGDCIVRAMSLACEVPYFDIVKRLYDIYLETGRDINSDHCWSLLLTKLGWKMQRRVRDPHDHWYTGESFCREIQKGLADGMEGRRVERGVLVSRRIVAKITGDHATAIIDGVIWDTWDCAEKTVRNYWVKKEDILEG